MKSIPQINPNAETSVGRRIMNRAIAHIKANSNCSGDCAKRLLYKQAMRVLSKERGRLDAVKVLFYTRFESHPLLQYQALRMQVDTLRLANS